MRYVKVLILALFFFLCLVFLFQNQNVLSQKLTLELNLLAIPKMTSIELPFYFIILVSFLAGCVMALLLLLWDRMRLSAHILQQTWRISNLENENHKLVEDMGKLANADEVVAYQKVAASKSDLERTELNKEKTGVELKGIKAVDPVDGREIPVFISDYVLATYGTGAIMAVPAHDERDYAFARAFDLPIIPLIEGADVSEESFDAKEGRMINSCGAELDLNGLEVKEAIAKTKKYIEEKGIGRVKVNYRLRDAIFSRQRYWGEPFPVYYKDGIPYMLPVEDLPLQLPEISQYLPTETGEPPLGRAED